MVIIDTIRKRIKEIDNDLVNLMARKLALEEEKTRLQADEIEYNNLVSAKAELDGIKSGAPIKDEPLIP